MQKIYISKKTYFISLIALIFVFGLSGCGKPQEDVVVDEGATNDDAVVEGGDASEGEVEGEGIQEIADIIDSKIFYSHMTVDEIQEFLDNQAGIIKDYTLDDHGDKLSVAKLIDRGGSLDLKGEQINKRILIVLLELRAQAITRNDIKEEELNSIMGVSQDKYLEYYRSRGYTEDKLKNFDAHKFRSQLTYVTEKLDKYYYEAEFAKEGEGTNLLIKFKDGTEIDVSDEGYSSSEYALKKVMAEIAESKEDWDYWISKAEDSFYDLYTKWFLHK